jgi:hypothetical protein
MRVISFAGAISLAFVSAAALAQQSPPTMGSAATPAPYGTDHAPEASMGPGLNVTGSDGSTRTVKAVPCTVSSRETDGFTTCVGIPDWQWREMRRHRGY